MSEQPDPSEPENNKEGTPPEPLAPETPAATPPAEEMAGEPAPPAGEVPPEGAGPSLPAVEGKPSPGSRILRRVLGWVVIALLLFGAGVIATYFVRVQPTDKQAAQSAAAQTAALQRADKLQNDLNVANGKVNQLQQSNADLKKQLEAAKAHALLWNVMSDVINARYNLALNSPADAKKALANTTNTMNSLVSYTNSQEPNLSSSTQQRLALVLTEIDRDPKTTASDLGILADQLKELEGKVFGQ